MEGFNGVNEQLHCISSLLAVMTYYIRVQIYETPSYPVSLIYVYSADVENATCKLNLVTTRSCFVHL